MRTYALLLVFCVSASSEALSQTNTRMLLIANQVDRTMVMMDMTGDGRVTVVPESGITGHEIGVDPETKTAFIPIYGNSGVGKPGTDGSSIDVVDLRTGKRTATIDLGHGVRPHGAVWDPHGKLLYVTTELDRSVSIVDPRTLKVVGSIPTGADESHMLALAHDGKRAYTANVGPGTISVLDPEARRTIAVIPVAKTIQRISISMDDRTVFTADQLTPRLALVDTATNAVKRWVALPTTAYGTAPTLDGRWLLITLPALNQVGVLDLETLRMVRTFDVPRHPSEILVRPDGQAAYISCMDEEKVALINTVGPPSEWVLRPPIPAGRGVDGLAWAP